MSKCKFALVFLVILVVYLQESQGTPVHVKKKIAKLPIVAAKVGLAKAAAAKVKLAALKKWGLVKTVAKAPFVLGKKAALFKIGAVKSLAAFKLAKANAALGLASKKVAPAVAAVAALPGAAAAAIPAAAAAAFKPFAGFITPQAQPVKPPVVDVYTLPISESQYHAAKPNAHYNSAIVSTYKDGLDSSRTFANGYSVSLLPEGDVATTYEYYSVPSVKYATVDRVDGQELPKVEETKVVVPHTSYGVPN